MKSFLSNVVTALYGEFGAGVSSLRILLPNMRSRLFFTEELSSLIDRPIWQPEFLTIDNLMSSIAGLSSVDKTRAVVELFRIYSKYHSEDLDSFYFWGEMLLADFDNIDKYMINADMLFTNISDLKNIEDDLEYFEEEQKEVIRRFWKNFGQQAEYSDEKRDFLNIWKTLGPIYHEFREWLLERGLAYSGMTYRIAAEKIKNGEVNLDPAVRYAAIGFNALSTSERVLFDYLRNVHEGLFFWDTDDYYLLDQRQEAGIFLRDNVLRYPQPAWFVNKTDNFTRVKRISTVSVPSDSIQCRFAATFLREVYERQGFIGKETAIVLADESLLVPLLYSIPAFVTDINVTMGYPLRETLAYSFVERLLKLQSNARIKNNAISFYHVDAIGLLTHPFVIAADAGNASRINAEITSKSRIYSKAQLFETGTLIEKIFSHKDSWQGVTEYLLEILSDVSSNVSESTDNPAQAKLNREFFAIIGDSLRKLANSLKDASVEITMPVYLMLCRRMLQTIRAPYLGEPLKGLQIMGILETRNLDFKNVMVMSMNDDVFPGTISVSSSFIPYNLRYGYGLPTPIQQDGILAYYFYRLLQRAETIALAYCSKNDDAKSGERSRYIYQLEYESKHEIERREISLDIRLEPEKNIAVDKDAAVMSVMEEYLREGGRTLSPTAVNTYLACPLKFYFRSIAGLKPDDDVTEDIDSSMFGTILHHATELLYRPVVNDAQPWSYLRGLDREKVMECVDKAINKVYYHSSNIQSEEYEGNIVMTREIVAKYIINNIVRFDASKEDYSVNSLEKDIRGRLSFTVDGTPQTAYFSGKSDRIDMLSDGRLQIVDYKTGTPHEGFSDLPSLMEGSVKTAAILQTFVYSMMASQMQATGELPGSDVIPALYYVRNMNKSDYSPYVSSRLDGPVDGYKPYREEFEALLGEKLTEIFSPQVPFTQCEDMKNCQYCDYDVICKRK